MITAPDQPHLRRTIELFALVSGALVVVSIAASVAAEADDSGTTLVVILLALSAIGSGLLFLWCMAALRRMKPGDHDAAQNPKLVKGDDQIRDNLE